MRNSIKKTVLPMRQQISTPKGDSLLNGYRDSDYSVAILSAAIRTFAAASE
jgi:hypothetical protein